MTQTQSMIIWLLAFAATLIGCLSIGLPWPFVLADSVVVASIVLVAIWIMRHEADVRRLRASSALETERWLGGRAESPS
jgi:uncharacterized membrane protein (DUF485 family)